MARALGGRAFGRAVALALTSLSAGAGAVVLRSKLATNSGAAPSTGGPHEQFAAFKVKYSRTYKDGTPEHSKRFMLFQQHVAHVEAQNSLEGRRWSAGVNTLADRTPGELERLRGYRHGARLDAGAASSAAALGLVGTSSAVFSPADVPAEVDWKNLHAMRNVQDQGSCGSCWAVSSATALRAHSELFQTDRTFSAQQIVDCTPNPKNCGGTGGCGGATAELAMEYVARKGLAEEAVIAYTAKDGVCSHNSTAALLSKKVSRNLRSSPTAGPAEPLMAADSGTSTATGGALFGMLGWHKLAENQVVQLKLAVAQEGPVVVSVAASSVWNVYASGVMSACDKDAVINHAVVLAGYGGSGPEKYWTIQNSWGPGWGEDGFARLTRLSDAEEQSYCGWDHSPEQGTACKGGPSKVWVCGSCGILYDSVVPRFALAEAGWWHVHGGRNATAVAQTSA